MLWVATSEITQYVGDLFSNILRICHKLVLTLKETKYKKSKHIRLVLSWKDSWRLNLAEEGIVRLKTNLFEV